MTLTGQVCNAGKHACNFSIIGKVYEPPPWRAFALLLLSVTCPGFKCIGNDVLALVTVPWPSNLWQAGADDFLPVLIYVVIQANPPALASNLEYIQRFRMQSHMAAEFAYFFTQLVLINLALETEIHAHAAICLLVSVLVNHRHNQLCSLVLSYSDSLF